MEVASCSMVMPVSLRSLKVFFPSRPRGPVAPGPLLGSQLFLPQGIGKTKFYEKWSKMLVHFLFYAEFFQQIWADPSSQQELNAKIGRHHGFMSPWEIKCLRTTGWSRGPFATIHLKWLSTCPKTRLMFCFVFWVKTAIKQLFKENMYVK